MQQLYYIAGAIIYHYIMSKDKPVSIVEFAAHVDMSVLTVKRIAKEVARVAG